jgi:hypothetical protein
MDVIGFLYVSLGNSSTVQLHNSLGSRRKCACSKAGFNSQNGDRYWRIIYYRKAAFCYAFLCGQNYSMQNIFIKKLFLFTVGSVCRVKQFTTGWQTFYWWRRGWNGVAEMAETSVLMLVEDMSRNKYFFQVRILHITFSIHLLPIYCEYFWSGTG